MRAIQTMGGMVLIVACTLTAAAQVPPQDAVITVPEVEVRSGPSLKFYATAKLTRGVRVRVVKDEGDFLAIAPPPGSFSWINARFIDHTIGAATATVLGDKVPVMVGSSLTDAKPTVEQVSVERGTQLVILGNSHTDEEGVWWPIQPPQDKEVRYIPKEAVKVTPPVEVVANSLGTPGATLGGAPNPATGGAAVPDPLWTQAQQAEQAGNIILAKQLYTALAQKTTDHNERIFCYNRINFLDQGNRGSVPPGYQAGRPNVASYGDPRLSPTLAPPPRPGPSAQAVSQYCYVRESASPAGAAQPAALPRPPAPPPVSAGTSQPSGPGRLYRAGFFVDGKQAYVLETSQGRPRLYVTAVAGLNLEAYVNRVVELYGPILYRGDLRTNYMTASQVTPLQ